MNTTIRMSEKELSVPLNASLMARRLLHVLTANTNSFTLGSMLPNTCLFVPGQDGHYLHFENRDYRLPEGLVP